ncbi:unnamed protein product [Sphagnum troendelagicum]
MVTKESNVGTVVGKARKGKAFVVEEDNLEIKWGFIKHDVAKFFALNESGTSSEDTLQKVLELFNSKHPKKNAFVFIHCWLILKDVLRCLRWSENKKLRHCF